MIKTCKCGKWYNTKTKCPNCDTVANNKYNEQQAKKRIKGKMKYTKESLRTDIDWMTGGYITKKEAAAYIIFLLKQTDISKDVLED